MPQVNPITSTLKLALFEEPSQAAEAGYDYNGANHLAKPVEVKEVVVIKNGTQGGKSTADFILEDETGQKFVFMIPTALLRSIPHFDSSAH